MMKIGSAVVAKGERAFGRIGVDLADGNRVEIPIGILNGTRDGPLLYLQAAQHGLELNGIAAITKMLKEQSPSSLSGTVIAVPVASPLALRARRHWPGMGPEEAYSDSPHNMNRTWPGDSEGNEAERMAYALFHQIVVKADYAVDFHAYSRWTASSVLAPEWNKVSVEMAEAFGLTFISLFKRPESGPAAKMFTTVATERGIPAITVELSGQWDLYPKSVEEGYRGIVNLMRHLGMVEEEPEPPKRRIVVGRVPPVEVRSPVEGLFLPFKEPGTEVKKGETLGRLIDTLRLEEMDVKSPMDGVIFRIGRGRPHADVKLPAMHALVDQGETIAVIYEEPFLQ